MDEPTIDCVAQADWERWLEANHADATGVWIRIAKKSSGLASVTADEGTEAALCFGWFDGHRRSLDASWFLQRYSPRSRRSSWSLKNRQRAESLIAAGRMRPAGLAAIEDARADGRWDAAYVSQAESTVPEDLAAALAVDTSALAAWDALGRSERYATMLPLLKAVGEPARSAELHRLLTALRNR